MEVIKEPVVKSYIGASFHTNPDDSKPQSGYILKVKDRPFAEGSEGFLVLICLYAQPLSAKECHVILPLMIATFIMQSVSFFLCYHKFIQHSIFSYTK